MSTEEYSVRLSDGREFGPAEMETILEWGREGRVPREALLVPSDGSPARPVTEVESLAAIVRAPPTVSTGLRGPDRADEPGPALIPVRNPAALLAYYLGLASLLPFIGLLSAIPAFVLGIVGLRRRKVNPNIKGAAHAWIGIIMGGVLSLTWAVVLLLMIFN